LTPPGERKFRAEPNPNAEGCASKAAQKVEERIGVFYQGVKSPLADRKTVNLRALLKAMSCRNICVELRKFTWWTCGRWACLKSVL